jgi:hypothetical protein
MTLRILHSIVVLIVMLRVNYAECHIQVLYAERRYAECHYAGCFLSIFLLQDIYFVDLFRAALYSFQSKLCKVGCSVCRNGANTLAYFAGRRTKSFKGQPPDAHSRCLDIAGPCR